MTDFLIKSSLCMMVLLAVYHLFLRREKTHRFNRFYLLLALALSFTAPFISIKILSATLPLPAALPVMPFNEAMIASAESTVITQQLNYPVIAAWSFYGMVTFILLIRFALNILHFIKKIRRNTHAQYGRATLVLVPELTVPHTFLHYIFLNKVEYQHNAIENEIYTHELTHVRQHHTFDLLFIEALKTLFWFNPLLYGFKKAIQLNHEFLADETVISSYNNTQFYQKLLLEKAVAGYSLNLASNLTYSVTKQRLVMMTKSTSVFRSALLKAVLAPVMLAGIFLLVSLKNVEKPEVNNALATTSPSGKHPSQEQWNSWKSDTNTIIRINNWQMKKSDLDQFNADDVLSYSDDFIKTNSGTGGVKQQEVFLYTKQGFEDHYNSLEWPKPIEYKEILKLRPKDGC